ncbi:ABC transporter ATP-binding protein [Thermoflavimicrobium daqui]|jgi:ABC-2 type transport system ATP-binding protein|uniref:ABC transporter ATP-binding protein n=1 Tax=Thermoflavimicrobium daqui TaxID=2137476 RepID=A0A364K660_9BACL|nr:ABC transporter ATP-binding protein [Thermoflavimicrobium daqui]RAL25784.1 ABC transporter ATP-binding protein [Thermoflavimicrobium daqui]
MQHVVNISGATKRFHNQTVIQSLSLSLPSHGFIGLVGPNGSGKTTFLRLLAGLIRPDEGQIQINGHTVSRRINHQVAYVAGDQGLYDFYTVQEMLHYAAKVYPDFQPSKATEIIQSLKINDHTKIKHLSKGQHTSLNIAISLSRQVPLILMDEPLAGLDPVVREDILKMFVAFAEVEKQTLIVSSHEVSEIEPYLDYVIFLNQGQLHLFASAEELRETKGQSMLHMMKEVAR